MTVQMHRFRPGTALAVLLAGAALSGCSNGWIRLPGLPGGSGADPSQVSDAPPSAALQGSKNFVVSAVDKVGPAVVRIDTVRRVVNPLGGLFGSGPSIQQQQGQGSGFITRSDGVVLTNAHVVEGANEVGVTLPDGRNFKGKVLGSDPITDVAVVKGAAAGLPVAPLGNSDNVRPGEWAIAIGNPLGLNNTVTLGIISAVQRTNALGEGQRVPYLQTDAAVNPGNSGGPLINDRGQVIGINTAIRQAPGAGLSFAIPINLGRQIAAQIIEKGRASHPYIGVRLQALTPQLAREVNSTNAECKLPETRGVVVVEVMPGSPAAKAGLRSCDLIETVGGTGVQDPSGVQVAVDQGRVGQSLTVVVQRNGRQLNLQVKPAELPRQN
ncbi:MAG: trypsin-like peptidase domain-containing protein [Vulcanococcus sp.]